MSGITDCRLDERKLIPDDLTKGMRDLIRLVLTAGAGAHELRQRILAAREAAAGERPANAVLKEEMSQSVRRLKELNGHSVTRDIRNEQMSSSARLGLLKMRAEQLCREFLDFDIPDGTGPKIPDFLLTRFVYARLWYQEHWLDHGGLESAKGLANDEFDMEYALTASFFDALLSKDDRATKLAEDLVLLSRPQHEQHLLDALWDYSVSKGIVTPATRQQARTGFEVVIARRATQGEIIFNLGIQ